MKKLRCAIFSLYHIPGKKNAGSDALSRFPWTPTEESEEKDKVEEITGEIEAIISEENLDPKWKTLIENSKLDPAIKSVVDSLENGNPIEEIDEDSKSYMKYKKDLQVQDGVLLFKSRPVIPKNMRKDILENVHQGHQGVTNMQSRLNDDCWWPNITSDLEVLRSRCKVCNEISPSQPKLPPVPPRTPSYPMQMVSAHYFELE